MTAIAGGTKIEWADFTFNPWWGCEKISPGCAHCYADTLAKRRAPGQELWGADHGFRFFGDGHWDEPLRWARNAPAKLGRRPRVFCASMADVFEDRPELAIPRLRLIGLIEDTPELDWLVLTKRPDFARDTLRRLYTHTPSKPWEFPMPRNLWMGVSIENSRFTWRADVLREIPAAIRFISAEPLLGSLFDAGPPMPTPEPAEWRKTHRRAALDLGGIDWVIVGGESGHGARPFHLEHAREIIRASSASCICSPGMCPQGCEPACPYCSTSEPHRPAVFVKQLGARPTRRYQSIDAEWHESPVILTDRKGGDISEWPVDLRIREFPRSAA